MPKEGEIVKPVDIRDILEFNPAKQDNKWFWDSKKHKKTSPQSFKYEMDVPTLGQRISEHIFRLLRDGTVIDSIKFRGKIAGQEHIIEFYNRDDEKLKYGEADENCKRETWSGGEEVSLSSENAVNFSVEAKEYKSIRFRQFKSKVDSFNGGDYAESVKHLKRIEDWLNDLKES